MKRFVLGIIIMLVVSICSLQLFSVIVYQYKWQADKALLGITVTYIFAGFAGGLAQRRRCAVGIPMWKKMLEAIVLSLLFMIILIGLSVYGARIPFELSSRSLMIFMLLMGSTCLGRIL